MLHDQDRVACKTGLLIMHGLRAKGSAAALINSKNPMWPVAEFSRSHSIRMFKVPPVLYYYRISIEYRMPNSSSCREYRNNF